MNLESIKQEAERRYTDTNAGEIAKLAFKAGASYATQNYQGVSDVESPLAEKIKKAFEYWKKFDGEKQQGIAYGLNLVLEWLSESPSQSPTTEAEGKLKDADLITDLIEYFESRADADGSSEGYKPNEEMQFSARLTLFRTGLSTSDGQDGWVEALGLLKGFVNACEILKLNINPDLVERANKFIESKQ